MARRKSRWASREISEALAAEGWRTPNTYGNEFEPLPAESGLYLFLHAPIFPDEGPGEAILYVGMSECIARRVMGHEVLREIRSRGFIQTWFKPFPIDGLRAEETKHIRRFRPPYNVIGRIRGENW